MLVAPELPAVSVEAAASEGLVGLQILAMTRLLLPKRTVTTSTPSTTRATPEPIIAYTIVGLSEVSSGSCWAVGGGGC